MMSARDGALLGFVAALVGHLRWRKIDMCAAKPAARVQDCEKSEVNNKIGGRCALSVDAEKLGVLPVLWTPQSNTTKDAL